MEDITFSEDEVRQLSGPAIQSLPRLLALWNVDDADGAVLLGVSPAAWEEIKAGVHHGDLTQEQLLRSSYLLGIFADLRTLFEKEGADRWPRSMNADPIFGNRTPIDAMLKGGVALMKATRRHLQMLMADPW